MSRKIGNGAKLGRDKSTKGATLIKGGLIRNTASALGHGSSPTFNG